MQKILLIDNDREYRQMMATLVRRAGYGVIQADEVAEANSRSLSDRPDLIMMELTLPAMNGVEITAWLKCNQFPFGIPVVIYTSEQPGSCTKEALSSAAVEVLTKPISSADVGEVLCKYLPIARNRPRPIASPRFDSSL
jgi:CheY-like chemotaxis protein